MSRAEKIEWVLIFLAMGVVWLWIAGGREGWWRLTQAAAIAAMVWVAVRRIGRVHKAC